MKKSMGLSLFFVLFSVQIARADLGFWSAALVGKWRNPKSGDTYRFRSDATYVFQAGSAKRRAAKRRAGNRAHSGFWKIVQPTKRESQGSMEGPVALRLDSRTRTVLEARKLRVLRSNRRFRIAVDVAKSGENLVDRHHYFIDGVIWSRVR